MGVTVAVWGREGSGKSTMAANLACYLAKKGNITGILDGKTTYGSIAHYLGVRIKEENSLKKTLMTFDEDDMAGHFTRHKRLKDLFVLGLSDQDDCSKIDGHEDFCKLIISTKDKFDCFIIDCDERYNDEITFLAFRYADIFIEVVRSNLQGLVFKMAHDSTVKYMLDRNRSVKVSVEDPGDLKTVDIQEKLKERFDVILPYVPGIVRNENTGMTLCESGGSAHSERKYIKGIERIARFIMRIDDPAGKTGRLAEFFAGSSKER